MHPATRTRYLPAAAGESALREPVLVNRLVRRFAEMPKMGAMAIRLTDGQGRTQRRHVPRLGLQDRVVAMERFAKLPLAMHGERSLELLLEFHAADGRKRCASLDDRARMLRGLRYLRRRERHTASTNAARQVLSSVNPTLIVTCQ